MKKTEGGRPAPHTLLPLGLACSKTPVRACVEEEREVGTAMAFVTVPGPERRVEVERGENKKTEAPLLPFCIPLSCEGELADEKKKKRECPPSKTPRPPAPARPLPCRRSHVVAVVLSGGGAFCCACVCVSVSRAKASTLRRRTLSVN